MAFAKRITAFGGISPRTSPRLLPENGAQTATNCKLYSGELVPLRDLGSQYDPAKTGPFVSIFKAYNGPSDSAWFTWNTDVDCVRVPLATDVESRFCWTDSAPPRWAKYTEAVAGGGDNYPVDASHYSLGIPNPQTAPTLSRAGPSSGSIVTRYYCYTFFSQDGEDSGPSPISVAETGYTSETWTVASMDTAPANSGTGTAAYTSVTTFTNGSSVSHWLRVGDLVVISGDTLTVLTTPTAYSFTVAGNYSAATSWTREDPWNTTGMTKRIYRTSGSVGSFQMVVDNIAVATTSYADSLDDAHIAGDDLISAGWEPPRTDLQGFIVHPSGALVGFVGNLLCFSEPYQPHAWIRANELAAPSDIVGIAGYNTEVVAGTKGSPFLASGVEPASMSGDVISGAYPCLSKRSMISVGDGVLYATQHGLAYVGQAGVSMFTQNWVTKEEWRAFNPDTMVAATANGRVYVSYLDEHDTSKTMVFEDGQMTTISLVANELYTDPASGTLYIGNATGIYEWDAPSAYPLSQTWRSKAFYEPTPINIGAAKINFELAIDPVTAAAIAATQAANTALNVAIIAANAVGAAYGEAAYGEVEVGGDALYAVPATPPSNEVTYVLYVNNEVYFSKIVTSTAAFRLPAGSKYFDHSHQISSQCKVQSLVVAETMDALKSA